MRSKTSTVVREEPTFIEAARRNQIVLCAIDAIAELGYQRASLAEIAKRAGVSKSVISYHFAGKDDLIRQIVADIYAAGTALMLPRLEEQKSARDVLRVYITSNIEFLRAFRKHVQAIVEIFASFRNDEGELAFDPRIQEPGLADLRKVFAYGQESGEFRAFDPAVMALALRSAIDALPPRIAADPAIDLDSYARELVDLFDRATRKLE